MNTNPSFFVAGGTLWQEAPSYIRRAADDELLNLTRQGEFCNVLASRQMGKSSLMVRTARRLQGEGFKTAIIDMSIFGSGIATPDEWFYGFLDELALQLDMDAAVADWWQAQAALNPLQKFSNFFRDVLLREISDPVVVFIDEIDSALGLDFADDFFAAVRAAYNARATNPAYQNLTFTLFGVALPADLIKDRTRTPYNIGTPIALTDFTITEVEPFRDALEASHPAQGDAMIERVLHWTNGQPYLTQKLCASLASESIPASEIDSTVQKLFLADEARKESNLRAIRDRIFSSPNKNRMLQIYGAILGGRAIPDEERDLAKNELKLTGLVMPNTSGQLVIRNRIYQQVYDEPWVKQNLPATRSRLTVAAILVAVLALAFAGYTFFRQSTQTVETYVAQFETSASPDVRLTSLARLVELEENATVQRLFESLPAAEQQSLFASLSDPQNLAPELVTVINAIYQSADEAILTEMNLVLDKIAATGAAGLKTEIELWLRGRQEIVSNPALAVPLLTSAWQTSESRGMPNSGILLDRARAHTNLGEWALALGDLENLLALDSSRTADIAQLMETSPALGLYWSTQTNEYPQIAAVEFALMTLTPTNTATPTASPTQTPSPTGTLEPSATPTTDYPLDVAFVSDKAGEFGLYRIASLNPQKSDAIPHPADYERVWWPSFCGGYIAAEVQDADGILPQWVHLFSPGYAESTPLHSQLRPAMMGVPRCSPNGNQIAYSIQKPNEFEGWHLTVNDFANRTEYLPEGHPGFGYATWSFDNFMFLSMGAVDGDNYIYQTKNFSTRVEYNRLIRGDYPALSPNGKQFVYWCADGIYLCLMDVEGGVESVSLLHFVRSEKVNNESIPVTAWWSGDGSWIYFASAADGDWDIYRIRPDGSDLINLTADWESNEFMPTVDWRE